MLHTLQHDFQDGIIILIIILTVIIITARYYVTIFLFIAVAVSLLLQCLHWPILGRSFCRFAVRFSSLSDYTKLVSRRD